MSDNSQSGQATGFEAGMVGISLEPLTINVKGWALMPVGIRDQTKMGGRKMVRVKVYPLENIDKQRFIVVIDDQGQVLKNKNESYVRWGIPREPFWICGDTNTTPAAGASVLSIIVSPGKTGRIFGVHIAAEEANTFYLESDNKIKKPLPGVSGDAANPKKLFILSGAGYIHVVDKLPLIDNVPGGSLIALNVVTAGAPNKIYQASFLYDEV